MSADDFRDLVSEFDHDAVTTLIFYRWAPPDFAFGAPVAGTGGYAAFTNSGPYAYVPNPPSEYIERLAEGDRQRESVLVWQWAAAIGGAPLDTLQTIDQNAHRKPDRIHDVDRAKWFEVATSYDYRAVAQVAGVVALLMDGDP